MERQDERTDDRKRKGREKMKKIGPHEWMEERKRKIESG